MRFLRRIVAALLVLAAALIASLIGIFAWYASRGPVPPQLAGELEYGSTIFEARERHWILYAPPNASAPRPLIVALPGSGQSAEDMRQSMGYRLEELAERDGFTVVFAQAWDQDGGRYEWNDCRKNTDQPVHRLDVNDAGFVIWLLNEIARRHVIDAQRVYAVGISDGGQMSYRLATEHPDRFAAVAAIVAQQAAPENSNCLNPRGPISVLVMNGTADPIIPYRGGEASFYGFSSAGQVQSIDGTIAHWKRVNGIRTAPVTERLPDIDASDDSSVSRSTWTGSDGRQVVLYSIEGGGHTVPGGFMPLPPFLLGATNQDIFAADEIWSFFRRHRLEETVK